MGIQLKLLKAASTSIVGAFRKGAAIAGSANITPLEKGLRTVANGLDDLFDAVGLASDTVNSAGDLNNIEGYDAANSVIRNGLAAVAGFAAGVFIVGVFAVPVGAAALFVGLAASTFVGTLVGDLLERLQEDHDIFTVNRANLADTFFTPFQAADVFAGKRKGETVEGKGGNDFLDGKGGSDSLNGNSGDDTINGGGGADTIKGGIGQDSLSGGRGADEILGEGGRDIIFGGTGKDIIDGGGAADTVYGGNSDDFILGDGGRDELYGGDEDDTIRGEAGRDSLYGGEGDDTIEGGASADHIFSDGGRDSLDGGAGGDTFHLLDRGRDTIDGGSGNDVIIVEKGGRYTIDGGQGFDIVDLRGSSLTKFLLNSSFENIEEIWTNEIPFLPIGTRGADIRFFGNEEVKFEVDPKSAGEIAIPDRFVFGFDTPIILDESASLSLRFEFQDLASDPIVHDRSTVPFSTGSNSFQTTLTHQDTANGGTFSSFFQSTRETVEGVSGQISRQDFTQYSLIADQRENGSSTFRFFATDEVYAVNRTSIGQSQFFDEVIPAFTDDTFEKNIYHFELNLRSNNFAPIDDFSLSNAVFEFF